MMASDVNGAPTFGGVSEIPMSCCMCEPKETAQSLGDDTHAVVKRPRWASEYGQHTWCGLYVGGRKAWLTTYRQREREREKGKNRERERKQGKIEGKREKERERERETERKREREKGKARQGKESVNLSVRAMVLSTLLPQHVNEGVSATCNCA